MQSQPPLKHSILITLLYGSICGLGLGIIEFFEINYNPLQYVVVQGYFLGQSLNSFIWLLGWLCVGIITARYTRSERYSLLAGVTTGFIQVISQALLTEIFTITRYGGTVSLPGLLSNLFFIALRAPSQMLLIIAAAAGVGILGGFIGKKFFQPRHPYRRSEAAYYQRKHMHRIAAIYGILAGLGIALLYGIITVPMINASLVPNQEPGTTLLWLPLLQGTVFLFVATLIASLLAAKREGHRETGRLAALWTGILGLLITFATILLARNIYIANIQSILIGNIAVLKEHFNTFYSVNLLLFVPLWLVGMAIIGVLGSSIGKRMAPATPRQAQPYEDEFAQRLQEMQQQHAE